MGVLAEDPAPPPRPRPMLAATDAKSFITPKGDRPVCDAAFCAADNVVGGMFAVYCAGFCPLPRPLLFRGMFLFFFKMKRRKKRSFIHSKPSSEPVIHGSTASNPARFGIVACQETSANPTRLAHQDKVGQFRPDSDIPIRPQDGGGKD